MIEGSFQFSPEVEFISPLYIHITLVTGTGAESACFARLLQCEEHAETFSIQMTLKELLLEPEWSEFILIWWFVSIKFIRSFLKFSFF